VTEYVSLEDYVILAGEILELDPLAIAKLASLGLADSALHAPMAEFGGQEMYPVFYDKAAVLLVHLTKNHPLPDGNKRAGWASLRLFLLRNQWTPRLALGERPLIEVSCFSASSGTRGF